MEKVIALAEKIVETIDASDVESYEKNLALELVPLIRKWHGTRDFLADYQQREDAALATRKQILAPYVRSEHQEAAPKVAD